MKHFLMSFFMFCFSLQVFSQIQNEEEIIFCKKETNPNIELKLTKTHDKLYTLYSFNTKNPNSKWKKIMDLGEPVIWTKNGVGEVADFYSSNNFSNWLRLFFDNSYAAAGKGEIVLTKTNDSTGEDITDKHLVKDCIGTLK